MILLTARGAFAQHYLAHFPGQVIALPEIGEEAFVDALKQASVIIHNAATVDCKSLDHALTRNFDFTRKIVQLQMAHNPEAHMVLLSSMSILDPTNDQAYRDPSTMNYYAFSKYLAELYCLQSGLKHLSCLRFSTLFYGDSKRDGLSKLVEQAHRTRKVTIYNDGKAKRDFLPIDIAARYVNAVTKISSASRTLNIASGVERSFRQVVDILEEQLGQLEIENQVVQFDSVLSTFTRRDVQALGEISFSLKYELANYARSLSL